jgi:hypothetical protein
MFFSNRELPDNDRAVYPLAHGLRNQFLLLPNSLFLIRLCSDSACGLHSLHTSFDPLWTRLLRRNLVGLLFSVSVPEGIAG